MPFARQLRELVGAPKFVLFVEVRRYNKHSDSAPQTHILVLILASPYMGTHASFANLNFVHRRISMPHCVCQEAVEHRK